MDVEFRKEAVPIAEEEFTSERPILSDDEFSLIPPAVDNKEEEFSLNPPEKKPFKVTAKDIPGFAMGIAEYNPLSLQLNLAHLLGAGYEFGKGLFTGGMESLMQEPARPTSWKGLSELWKRSEERTAIPYLSVMKMASPITTAVSYPEAFIPGTQETIKGAYKKTLENISQAEKEYLGPGYTAGMFVPIGYGAFKLGQKLLTRIMKGPEAFRDTTEIVKKLSDKLTASDAIRLARDQGLKDKQVLKLMENSGYKISQMHGSTPTEVLDNALSYDAALKRAGQKGLTASEKGEIVSDAIAAKFGEKIPTKEVILPPVEMGGPIVEAAKAEEVARLRGNDYLLSPRVTGTPSNKTAIPTLSSQGLETNLPSSSTKILSSAGASKSIEYVSPSQLNSLRDLSIGDVSLHSDYSKMKILSEANKDAFIQDIRKVTNLEPDVRIKDQKRFLDKLKMYESKGTDPANISDVIGGRIVVPKNDVYNEVNKIAKNFDIVETRDYFKLPSEYGYRAVNIKVKLPNGQLAEIQVHTPDSLAAAKLQHKILEKWEYKPLSSLTNEEKISLESDLIKSRNYYKETKPIGTGAGLIEETRILEPTAAGGMPTKKYVGGLNIEQFSGPEDLRGMVQQQAEINKGMFVEHAPQTIEQIRADANALGITADDAMARKIGGSWSPKEQVVMKDAITAQTKKMNDLRQIIDVKKREDVALYTKEMVKQMALIDSYAGGRSQTARALAIGKVSAKELLDRKLYRTLFKAVRNEDELKDAIERMLSIPADDFQVINQFIGELTKSSYAGKIYEAWVNGVLSGPRTHVRNLIGNTIAVSLLPIEKTAVGALNKAKSAIFGKPQERFAKEAVGTMYGMASGLKDGARAFLKAFATEQPSFGSNVKYLPQTRVPQIKGKLGRIIRIPGRFLTASDEFAKTVIYRGELHGLAYRQALQEGLKGRNFTARIADLVNNPTEAMIRASKNEAIYRTFQSELGPISSKISIIRNVPFGKYVLPFYNVPVAITKFGLERTPLGFLRIAAREAGIGKLTGTGGVLRGEELEKALVRAGLGTVATVGVGAGVKSIKDTLTGDIIRPASQPQAFQPNAKGKAIGTLIAGGIAQMWAEGMLTGSAPQDPQARKIFYASGKKPYAVRIGNQWVQYGTAPMGTMLGLTVDLLDMKGQVNGEDRALLSGLILAKNFGNQSFMQGLSNLMDAYSNPEQSGQKFINQWVGSLVPYSGLTRSISQASDKNLRIPNRLEDSLKVMFPGWREDIPVMVDIWGRPVYVEGGVAERFLSPIQRGPIDSSKAMQEVDRLNVKLPSIQKRIGDFEIGDESLTDAKMKSGQMAFKLIENFVTGSGYDKLADQTKSDVIQQLYSISNEVAKAKAGITQASVLKHLSKARTISGQTGNKEREEDLRKQILNIMRLGKFQYGHDIVTTEKDLGTEE